MKMATPKTNTKETENKFVFNRENYYWLIGGLILMAIGFILLVGGGSKDPEVFNDSLFDFQRLTLAPILILAGLVVEFYAIMKRPKKS